MSAFVPPVPAGAAASPPVSAATRAAPVVFGGAPLVPRRGGAPALARAAQAAPARSGAGGGASPGGAPHGCVVVWLRGDLRLHDHSALAHALEEAEKVVPVYCFDPRQFGKTAYGFEKTGRYRAKFLVEAVGALRDAARKKGADLVVRRGRPEDVLGDVCKRVGADRVYFHREVSYEEQLVEEGVCEGLRRARVEAKPFWSNTLYHVEDLPFAVHDMPDVYSDFRERVQRDGAIRPPLPAPRALPALPRGLDVGEVPSLTDLGLAEPDATSHGLHAFVGGEEEALRRLNAYIAESLAPAGASAAIHLGADFSCKISPWLALGCVSPRRIHADLAEKAAKAGQASTFFELVWRDFFRLISVKYAKQRMQHDGKAKGTKRTLVGSRSLITAR